MTLCKRLKWKRPHKPVQLSFDAIGTHWQVDCPSVSDSPDIEKSVLDRINNFDLAYSRFKPDSLITQISKQPGTYKLPPDAKPLLEVYHDLYKLTQGLFTPLIGNTLSAAGYDANYSLTSKTNISKPVSWEEAINYDFPNLTVKKPVLLDFGAAGKGYLVDLVGKVLRGHKVTEFTIDAGGDILHIGSPIRIGLEHPENLKQVIGVATINNASLCGSSGNRRKWGKYHHILNPRSLSSPENILSVWTAAKTALLADAMATALFLVAPESLTSYAKFDYLILFSDFSFDKSPEFPVELFTNENPA